MLVYYALPVDGVSRARSATRAARRAPSIPSTSGCAPPSTRRAIRSVSSSVVTALRRSSIGTLSPQEAADFDLCEMIRAPVFVRGKAGFAALAEGLRDFAHKETVSDLAGLDAAFVGQREMDNWATIGS